ncbi:PQQ-binding-like beta-propeller repeat protein [Nocardiopsis sp. NPDC006198]|uniref:outer membrane protein assembly factor BamB family protein n=1 Tax=Nocardiopsis sp. NPDC006198 TaxID=3154472 RepID=UPI0033B7AD2E
MALFVVVSTGCAAQGETVADAEVADDARGAFTMAEVEAVEEFLADDQRGPATELLATGSGVLALFDDQVVSFGADPVAEAWRHEISEPVRDVSVASTGEAVLLRYGADVGPVAGERVTVLDAERGRVLESYIDRGETAAGEGHLLRSLWVATDPGEVLRARRIADGEVAWEHNLTDTCSGGRADDIEMVDAGTQLLVAYACGEDGTAHVAMLDGSTGEPFWEESWAGDPVPRVHVVHEHTVPGGPDDPVSRMFADEASGETAFLYGSESDGVEVFVPEPWRSAPGVGKYAAQPMEDFEAAPRELVLHSAPRRNMHDHVLLGAVRWLVEEDSVPFTTEDIDESLLIDGEVVQNPRQWTVGAPGYVSALLVEVEEAFS